MTISSTVRTAGPYTGTGSVNTYPFAFKVFQASDLLAQQTDTSGNITTLVLTTNYSVTLNADQNASPGGSIVLNSNLPSGYKLILSSQVPELQGTSITNNGGFYPQVVENALDYLTILTQQLQTELTQCMQLPLAVQGVSTTLPAPVGGSLLGWNATGTAIVNTGASGIGAGSVTDVNVAANAAVQASKLWFTPLGTGAVPYAVQTRMQQLVSVKDYGAKGDGVTNDTAAVTAALNYAGAHGLTAYFPNGIYLLTSRIGLTAGYNPSIKGQSYGGATLRASGITLNGNGFIDYTSASNFVVEDMVFDFNNSTITVGSEEAIGFINCTDFYFNRNRVLHLVGSGVVTNGCNRFWITNNYIAKDVAANTFNVGINVESASRQSTDGYIIGNQLVNTASDYSCTRCTIAYNRVSNWKFGSGITTEQDSVNSNFYTIVGNICYGSSGTDVNATNPCGIEQWGAYSIVADNICYSNSGDGISQGGQHSTATGNVCFNNGQTAGSGITSRYGTSAYNASYSTYAGNNCFDTQGTKTQVYGYQDQSASLQYISLFGNNFDGANKTGPQNVLAAVSSHDGPQIEGSYTINPGTIANGASANFAETLNGAEVGDMLIASHSTDLQSCSITAYCNAANSIVISYYNLSGGSKTITSGTARVRAIKPRDYANY